ncbi:MAG: hypothetical protein ACW99Q_01330 [Candidatus Kariarchaeaceae archaeon]
MTESLQTVEGKKETAEKLECYICSMDLLLDKSMEIPLTTGGNVRVHPSCMEFYLSQARGPNAAACGGCSGNAGCC